MVVPANTLVHLGFIPTGHLFFSQKWADAGGQDFLESSHKKEILASISFHAVERAFHFKHD